MLKLSKNEKRVIKGVFGLMLVWTLIDGIRSMTYQDPLLQQSERILQEWEDLDSKAP